MRGFCIMKIRKIAKLFNTSKESFVSSNLVSFNEKGDDKTLISNIYYDSGVERRVFYNLYLNTLKRFYSGKWGSSADPDLLIMVRSALRKRRSFYLPKGVVAESVHALRDVWTFAVFVTGLLLHVERVNHEEVLKKILDKKAIAWLKQKNVWEVLTTINVNNGSEEDVALLRSFYIDAEEVGEQSVRGGNEDVSSNNVTASPTNKEIGTKCLTWLFRHAESEAKLAYFIADKLLIRSPSAFIAFSKASSFNWKSAQKGVTKLRLHEPNKETGTPFHKIDNHNVMVILQTKIKV